MLEETKGKMEKVGRKRTEAKRAGREKTDVGLMSARGLRGNSCGRQRDQLKVGGLGLNQGA